MDANKKYDVPMEFSKRYLSLQNVIKDMAAFLYETKAIERDNLSDGLILLFRRGIVSFGALHDICTNINSALCDIPPPPKTSVMAKEKMSPKGVEVPEEDRDAYELYPSNFEYANDVIKGVENESLDAPAYIGTLPDGTGVVVYGLKVTQNRLRLYGRRYIYLMMYAPPTPFNVVIKSPFSSE